MPVPIRSPTTTATMKATSTATRATRNRFWNSSVRVLSTVLVGREATTATLALVAVDEHGLGGEERAGRLGGGLALPAGQRPVAPRRTRAARVDVPAVARPAAGRGRRWPGRPAGSLSARSDEVLTVEGVAGDDEAGDPAAGARPGTRRSA